MQKRDSIKRPYVVGIAGGSGSGKTYLCEELEKRLHNMTTATLHTDHYFFAQKPTFLSDASGKAYEDYDHPDAVDLQRLLLDLDGYMLAEDVDVILIEGLHVLYHKTLRIKLDLKIFVDCQADERMLRKLQRDVPTDGTFQEVSSFYLDVVRHRHDEFVEPSRWHADIIMNGAGLSPTSIDFLAKGIAASIS